MKRNEKNRPRRRGGAGFTLVEVLLVLIILVIIGSIVVPNLFGAQEKANINATKTQIRAIDGAIDLYRIDMAKAPSTLDDLREDPSTSSDDSKWSGPYLKAALKPDPWGNEYQYAAEGKKNTGGYDIWSYGPDGKNGTDDDIGNWE